MQKLIYLLLSSILLIGYYEPSSKCEKELLKFYPNNDIYKVNQTDYNDVYYDKTQNLYFSCFHNTTIKVTPLPKPTKIK